MHILLRMWIPKVCGRIERRLLVNYRAEPSVVARLLPAPMRPVLVGGNAIVGICLIRLAEVRVHGVPRALGFGSENAAHRIAVEWDEGGEVRTGVYIPRRDTSSRLNALAGGRLFPGEHHRARFEVDESDGVVRVAVKSDDGRSDLAVVARAADGPPPGSVFASTEDASKFFQRGSLGFSVTRRPTELDALELRTFGWAIEPLVIESVTSSWFADAQRFPAGSLEPDSAFLMRNLEHEWHGRGLMQVAARAPAAVGAG